ncbi:alpha/beta hydrolase [Yinghuangia sp. YIM S09857]|uniref:alpha/beta hydrolase n=1 Tax=Yinghuangia sp. YIM S09857 TaxID=3436929 RepID=UPI003F52FEA1
MAAEHPVRIRVYRPTRDNRRVPAPAVLWMHGGGMVMGNALQDDRLCARFARELGTLVVSVDYRLAPEHRYPAALEDCYAALAWLRDHGDVDSSRIAVAGSSAGGGLAAGVAQTARDRGEITLAFQLLSYPMLDDRTVANVDHGPKDHVVWNTAANRFGWNAYLGIDPGSPTVASSAVPARREHLGGLPPGWIGVGSEDLFWAEGRAYALRLRQSGVPCEFFTVPGAFHGFDALAPKATVSRDFVDRQVAALAVGLGIADARPPVL